MDYLKLNNTYFTTPKDNPKDRIEVEIGDSKVGEFIPQVKIKRWDNEVNCSIRLLDDDLKDKKPKLEDGKIKVKGDKLEAHFYELTEGEGGYEFEVILKEKSLTNVLTFSLEDKDVEYFYQPPLTQQEIDEESIRPENVVGSYAVYVKTPKTNWTGGKEYKVGKIGHIYRPKIIDAEGTEVWGELHIENGILTVTIPTDFLDSAVYPIRHAAGLTFGYTTIGASAGATLAYNSNDTSLTYATNYTLGENATLDNIKVAMFIDEASDTAVDVWAGIYREDSAGENSHALVVGLELLNETIKSPNIAAATWHTFNGSSQSLVADDYLLAALGNGVEIPTVGKSLYMPRDSTESHRIYFESSLGVSGYDTRKADDPWAVTDTTYTRTYSIYATYTAVGGTVSSSPSGSASGSASASKSLSPSASESFSASASASKSGSASESKSASASASGSLSPSGSESKSLSQSASASKSLSPSASESKSLSPSGSESKSESKSGSGSLSSSASESKSVSASASGSESKSESKSLSPSESESKSGSKSESKSLSQSQSGSFSVSPSGSESVSESPSGAVESESESASESKSGSASASKSLSPSGSGSASGSASASKSLSPSGSGSASLSPSGSASASGSASGSKSESKSLSPSASGSKSESASPSAGYEGYTRGDYVALPADDTVLETNYSAQDYLDVDTNNDVRVEQTATQQYMIHQFKDFVGSNTACTLEWEGQSDLAPTSSAVVLEIYNHNTDVWDLVDSDNTTDIDTDFVLTGVIADLTNYKDAGSIISCRVYQEAI